ncbi:hypothetical protein MMU07_17120 [Aquiflexum sp. LQ15W]|uniref:hypothetical protein n=1 Tax=Cognataquiflexum nitidum TaxID=2922272 RepID=UPI001F135C83|nr:hypothetical protein [Cognataquiflexum nitidum]MCH6201307.1 hypothetical protein [Cognataquiflexum nitidum]
MDTDSGKYEDGFSTLPMATNISLRRGGLNVWRNLWNGKFDNQILKENPVLENWWGGGSAAADRAGGGRVRG